MQPTRFNIGYLELTLAQIFLSVNIIFGKMLASHYPIMGLLTLRFLMGFSVLAVYLAFSAKQTATEIKALKKMEWLILLIKAFCGGFLFNILTLYGLQSATATDTGIVHSTIPGFVALFSCLILRERLTTVQLFALLLTVCGILLLSVPDMNVIGISEMRGLIFIFLSVIPASLFTIFSKMINASLKPLTAVMLMNFVNTLLFFPLALQENWGAVSTISFVEWLKILTYCISGSLLFFIFWYKGIARVTASTAALFIGIMPISTALIAYSLLSESLSVFDIFGMLCIVASIYIGTLKISLIDRKILKI